jgi:uncharacterized protein YndB with AHSA1/START domain
MKAVRIILIVLGVLLLALVGAYFAMPSHIHVASTETLDAPHTAAFSHANNLRTWSQWTAWAQKDTTLRWEYSETSSAVGDWMRWKGKDGNGKLTLTEVVPNEKLVYTMEFDGFKPSSGTMTFANQDGKTQSTWTMDADLEGPFRLMALVFESAIKEDYAQGFKGLEAYAQQHPVPDTIGLAPSTPPSN